MGHVRLHDATHVNLLADLGDGYGMYMPFKYVYHGYPLAYLCVYIPRRGIYIQSYYFGAQSGLHVMCMYVYCSVLVRREQHTYMYGAL